MKQTKRMKRFTNYIWLVFALLFTFITLYIIENNNNMYIDLFGKRVSAKENILLKDNNEYYLSYEYIKENIDNEIYFDSVSRKIVISSDIGLFKLKLNDSNISINYVDNKLNNKGVIQNKDKYISLEVLEKAYKIGSTVCNNTIYLYDETYLDAKVKYNNVSVYKEHNLKSNIVDYVDKKDKIKTICENGNFVFVKINDNKVGYVLKNSVKYTLEKLKEQEKTIKNNIYIFADANNDKIKKELPIDGVIVDMFDVTQISTNIKENNINNKFLDNINKNGYKLYGMIGNGYDLAGFNTNTISQILSDETKRINLINNLNIKLEEYNLEGIVLDFKKLNKNDIQNYIQFIKELKSFLKKEVIVNIDASEYKMYIPVINYTDFSIVNAYGQRDLKSTVSGSVSEISWMKEIVEKCLSGAGNEKIIVGIPAYTILWTEKNSNVVDTEIYNLKATENYVEKNNLELKEVGGQNYSQLQKGALTCRMWLEDELSIKNRLNIIKDNKLAGVAIYKLGYENNALLDSLKNY